MFVYGCSSRTSGDRLGGRATPAPSRGQKQHDGTFTVSSRPGCVGAAPSGLQRKGYVGLVKGQIFMKGNKGLWVSGVSRWWKDGWDVGADMGCVCVCIYLFHTNLQPFSA